MVGEEKRHQMMQNLFGDQSDEEEEEEEDVESEHESNRQPGYASDEGDARVEPEIEVEGEGEAEVESEGELHDGDHDKLESDAERGQSSQEDVVGDQKFESEGRESESDEREEYGQRVATSKRREIIQSGSDRSEQNESADNLDEEVNQTASPRSPDQEKNATNYVESAPEIRDVFGDDSDEEEPAEYEVQNRNEEDSNRSPTEEEDNYEKLRPEDILADEGERYESEEERVETNKVKEKPVGPPLELEIPFRHPPAPADRLNMIKVSNIMGIDPKPFDPKTYVEEENFVTDDSGSKRRIRLENNIVRWRKVRNADGSASVESNARFVRWSDGSLQLLIGNEVLDISIQDAQHDQSHLFLRHGKGILQSQGKILKKMRFMPSSLTSNSHRMLTALVDSRHKKVYKVKNCVTDMDPEREKEQRERAASQTIKATELLNKKKEKVKHKYNLPPTRNSRKERELSPGFLDDDEEGDYESRRPTSRRHFDDFEMEVRAEKRIINAKKGHKDISRKPSFPMGSSSRRPVDDYDGSDMEESEYETEGEEEEEQAAPARRRAHEEEEEEPEYEDEEEEEADEEENVNEPSEEEDEEPRQKAKAHGSSLKRKIDSDEDSPPRKMAPHRRMAIVYDSDED